MVKKDRSDWVALAPELAERSSMPYLLFHVTKSGRRLGFRLRRGE